MKNFKKLGFSFLLLSAISCSDDKNNSSEVYNSNSEEIAQPQITSLTSKLGTDCNPKDTNSDLTKTVPVNSGSLDDRTCKYIYSETTFGTSKVKWGVYQIAENTSTDADLSPRMERFFSPRVKPGNDTYQYFKGTFRIESVSDIAKKTSIFQIKGKHKGSTGDPAIALFVVQKVVVGKDTYFDIYREQIIRRGGRFSDEGRKYTNALVRVKKLESFNVEIKTGFSGTPVNKHYANVRINGKWFYFDVPDPKSGTESAIRYGTYVCDSGTAKIYVSNTSFSQKD